MSYKKQNLELTWIGKENRPRSEPRILLKSPEKLYHAKHRSLFEAQDKVDLLREEIISYIEGKLTQKSGLSHLFAVRWSLR